MPILFLMVGLFVAYWIEQNLSGTGGGSGNSSFDGSFDTSLDTPGDGGGLAGVYAFNPVLSDTSSDPGQSILAAAQGLKGTVFGLNGCGKGVCAAVSNAGYGNLLPSNPNFVPDYAGTGEHIGSLADLAPGDLVIYNTQPGTPSYNADGSPNLANPAGWNHIGIYAGNGQAWNDSTSLGYKWGLTSIGNAFQYGIRLGGN